MRKNIVLDFGHGGIDKTGHYTTSPNKMFEFPDGITAYEGVLNRRIGGLLEIYLQSLNVNVHTTVNYNDPRDISLSYRVRVANSFPPNETLFVSIHSNASPFNNASGFELFTYLGESTADKLAEDIADSVEPLYTDLRLRLRYDFSDGDKDKEADYYVLRKTACPAVLLECLFFDYRSDFDLLVDPEFQKELAFQIFKGIKTFLERDI